ncbi:MAG: hypothetical protein ACK5ZT_02085 [Sphingobacteriaceae bacterium]
MKQLLIILSIILGYGVNAQVTCESLKTVGTSFSLTACKNGKGKLFYTDTALTNKFKYKSFDLKLVSDLTEAEKAEMKKYKINLNPTDTVIMYDWDILHQAKMGYFGPAVGKVRFDCKDSIVYIQKYLFKKETTTYVPTRFKIFRMGQDNFVFYDMDHPYLNINYYFKKK